MLVVAAAVATPLSAVPLTAAYTCGRRLVTAAFVRNRVALTIDGKRYVLPQVRSASGARYTKAGVVFWSKGQGGTLKIGRRAAVACIPDAGEPMDVAYRAMGQEPGWSLDIAADGRGATFAYDYGQKTVRDMLGAMVANNQGATLRRGKAIEVRTFPGGCNDAMSGKPYPERVTVMMAERNFEGCGGMMKGEIAGGEWVVEDIGGAGIIDSSRVTLTVEGDCISGRSGCNRYNGSFMRDAAGITIGPLVTTRMACPPALMDQEAKFVRLLEKVTRFIVQPDGALVLQAPGGTILARRDR